MEKKSFVLGYSQVINWFIAWAMFGFVNASGSSLMRSGAAELQGVELSDILQVCALIGWIGTFIYLGIPGAIKKIGAKNVLVVSAILSGVLCMLVPFAKSAILIGILLGFIEITACIFCVSSTMQLVSKWFPRKKASIMGIITAGGILATLGILPAYNAILASSGFEKAMIAYGAFTIAYGIISKLWLKETPQEVGLLPDNMPIEVSGSSKIEFDDVVWNFREVMKKKNFWFVSLGWGMELLATVGFITIAVPYMLMHGVPQPNAIWAMSLLGVIQFVISTGSGFVDQKIGPVKTSIVILLLQLVGFAIIALYGSGNMYIPMLAVWLIMGIFGASNNLYSSQTLSIFGPANFAVAFNGLVFVTGITKPLGQMIAGKSLEMTGDYMLAGKIYAVCMVIGLILVIIAGDKKIVPTKK